MSITTPCFIRTNTPELCKQLEELGYKCYGNPFQITDTSRLITTLDGEYVPYNVQLDNSWIDCGTNEPLFLAIAALRDDIDRGQWFVLDSDNIWEAVGCYQHKGDFELCDNRDKWYGATDVPTAHKATVKELIEHFKTNKQ